MNNFSAASTSFSATTKADVKMQRLEFSRANTSTKKPVAKLSHEELEAQMAEFANRGGNVIVIAAGKRSMNEEEVTNQLAAIGRREEDEDAMASSVDEFDDIKSCAMAHIDEVQLAVGNWN